MDHGRLEEPPRLQLRYGLRRAGYQFARAAPPDARVEASDPAPRRHAPDSASSPEDHAPNQTPEPTPPPSNGVLPRLLRSCCNALASAKSYDGCTGCTITSNRPAGPHLIFS